MFKIEKVNRDHFEDIPTPCKFCLYWQTTDDFGEEMLKPEMAQGKQKWFNKVTEEFGNCIKIGFLDGNPIGFVQYAPAKFFPRVKEYPSGPPSEDAVFISCLYIINKGERDKGFGKAMLDDLIAESKERRSKAFETFARKGSADNPSGPLKLYLNRNFRIKAEKDDFPLIRLEP